MSKGLVLFFTRGVSLRTWDMIGNLDREIALYHFLIDHGWKVSFITYGDSTDLSYADRLGEIGILCNERGLPVEDFESQLFSIHGKLIKTADVIKTNQTYGGELAVWTSRLLRKPLVARCGYMWSFNAAAENGEMSPAAIEARRVEEKVFEAADKVVVTTNEMRLNLWKRFPGIVNRVAVIPNYVDTNLFKPTDREKRDDTLLFIGRIAPEKNLESLLNAIRPTRLKLIIVGEGKLRPALQEKFGDLNGRVIWEGNVPNSKLPEYINSASIFVLPSFYEGHPKALLEAMACGATVIAADSPGIKPLIRHCATGYLCGTDSDDIHAALNELMTRPKLRNELGRSARQYVIQNYSLDKIGKMELDLLDEVANRR